MARRTADARTAVAAGARAPLWRVAAVVVAAGGGIVVFGGADCVPESGIGEAADCCDCLGDFAPDGEASSLQRGNCLPTLPGVPNLGISDERQVCAEAAGQALQGAGDGVAVVAACLDEGHPCDDPCARAAAVGVTFDPR